MFFQKQRVHLRHFQSNTSDALDFDSIAGGGKLSGLCNYFIHVLSYLPIFSSMRPLD